MHAFAKVLLKMKKSWAVDKHKHLTALKGSVQLVTWQMS